MVKTRIIGSMPAMILQEQKKHLVITDLHIGFENTFSRNKIFLGNNSSIKQITAAVTKLILKEYVDSLILLGDTNQVFKELPKMNGTMYHIFLNK